MFGSRVGFSAELDFFTAVARLPLRQLGFVILIGLMKLIT